MATAFATVSELGRQRCNDLVHCSTTLDLLVRAEAPGDEAWEGVFIAGDRRPDGTWALDSEFLIFITDERPEGQPITVHEWDFDVQPF